MSENSTSLNAQHLESDIVSVRGSGPPEPLQLPSVIEYPPGGESSQGEICGDHQAEEDSGVRRAGSDVVLIRRHISSSYGEERYMS